MPDESLLPPWLREKLAEEENQKIREQRQQIQLPVTPLEPMPKERVAEESDIIEEEGNKRNFIEFDIS
jgi:hypothetical protein